jgi:glucokinase
MLRTTCRPVSRGALKPAAPAVAPRTFVSAYGAAAGNLALTVLATGGLFLGGGIAPRNLDALRWPIFMQSFLDKSPMPRSSRGYRR